MQFPPQQLPLPQFGDSIENLPTDKDEPNPNEIQLSRTLFKQIEEKNSVIQKTLSGSKELVVLFLLFILFASPLLDKTVRKVINVDEMPYLLLIIKGTVLCFVYFVLMNINLMRRKN